MSDKYSVLPQTKWTADALWTVELKALSMLLFSLVIMGVGDGLLVLSELGSAPGTVLAQGIALQGHFSVGWGSLIVSVVVMLLWFPLKLKPGLGTILNVLVIALFLGLTVVLIPKPIELFNRILFALFGIGILGIGTALYLTCHMGAGPRDGLMVGLCHRFNWKIGVVRTCLEVTMCISGWLLGGILGLGTLLFAFSIGWIVQLTLSFLRN
ncbi:hypothetical protein EDC44_10742 [Cricetibacter osteomyelitidis]|uniref:Membrane protein YczE n=1 Tax=Cricetibacter osteomyelitidis TaxID=1521931 RepID=A0A4R2T2W5_9PAST|nr:YitT family protein [Cricetibacter osteomyelitidis]TCP95761.1 hypothetical protein EDC44_10742 [Cricetibacter osteomyelitidis]